MIRGDGTHYYYYCCVAVHSIPQFPYLVVGLTDDDNHECGSPSYVRYRIAATIRHESDISGNQIALQNVDLCIVSSDSATFHCCHHCDVGDVP